MASSATRSSTNCEPLPRKKTKKKMDGLPLVDWWTRIYRHSAQIGDRQNEMDSFCEICRGHQRTYWTHVEQERPSQNLV